MIRINWLEGFGNLPTFTLEESLDLLPREECEFQFKNGIWWHIQDNGLVRYYAHSGADKNEGGFGGAVFEIRHKGQQKMLKGPWSSRASYLNTLLPANKQVAEINLNNGKSTNTHIGILVSELIDRWESQEAYLLRSITEREKGSYTASLAADCIRKPDGMRFDPAHKYEVVAEPICLV